MSREDRKNALEMAGTGAALFAGSAAVNEALDRRLKAKKAPGLMTAAYRSATKKPNGLSRSTHLPHVAGRVGTRAVQLASLPLLAVGTKNLVTGKETRKVDVTQDVFRPTVKYATFQDQVKRGEERLAKASWTDPRMPWDKRSDALRDAKRRKRTSEANLDLAIAGAGAAVTPALVWGTGKIQHPTAQMMHRAMRNHTESATTRLPVGRFGRGVVAGLEAVPGRPGRILRHPLTLAGAGLLLAAPVIDDNAREHKRAKEDYRALKDKIAKGAMPWGSGWTLPKATLVHQHWPNKPIENPKSLRGKAKFSYTNDHLKRIRDHNKKEILRSFEGARRGGNASRQTDPKYVYGSTGVVKARNIAVAKTLNSSEQSRLDRQRKAGRALSLTSGTLGLAALGLRSPQAARALGSRGVKGLGRLAAHEQRATNLSNTLGIGAIGVGSAGSFNYAAQQRLERKRDVVAKGLLRPKVPVLFRRQGLDANIDGPDILGVKTGLKWTRPEYDTMSGRAVDRVGVRNGDRRRTLSQLTRSAFSRDEIHEIPTSNSMRSLMPKSGERENATLVMYKRPVERIPAVQAATGLIVGGASGATALRIKRKRDKDKVSKARLEWSDKEIRENKALLGVAYGAASSAPLLYLAGRIRQDQGADKIRNAQRVVEVPYSTIAPDRARLTIGSSGKPPFDPKPSHVALAREITANRRGVYTMVDGDRERRAAQSAIRQGSTLMNSSSKAQLAGVAVAGLSTGALALRIRNKKNSIATQRKWEESKHPRHRGRFISKGIPTKAWIKRNGLPVRILEDDGPDHFMTVHEGRMDGMRQRFHRDELRFATKKQTKLTPTSPKAAAKPVQLELFEKSFLRQYRDRISPEAETGYRHLRRERNENVAAAAGNAGVAGLSGWLLSHEAMRRPVNRPAAAVTAASMVAAGYGATRSGRVANRRNKSMNKIEAKARARAQYGMYGPGRGKSPVDMTSAKAKKYATVQGMDGGSE